MRKPLIASLSACLVASSFIGCGEQTTEKQVSEKLDVLLDKMSRLEYADVPIEGNKLVYTLGVEVDGVQVPGSTAFEAAYIDQALALLPLAEEIEKQGSKLQKQSANAIIGSIKADEAAYLIDVAELSFQKGAGAVVAMRSSIAVLREIKLLNDAVAGDRSEIIQTLQEGLSEGGVSVVGTTQLQAQADAAGATAKQASDALGKINAKIDELNKKVDEYEGLELKLSTEARSAKAAARYDKLDQATTAAKESQSAEAEAESLALNAWINEQNANLAEFKRQRLDGSGDPAALLGQLDAMMKAAAEASNVSDSSDTFNVLAASLSQAKAGPGDDRSKAAAFLLGLSDYAAADAPDSDERGILADELNKRVDASIGVIGLLEMKVEQVKIEQRLVAGKLAEIEKDRQDVLAALTGSFNAQDALIQAAGFDRMAAAVESLKTAQAAIDGAGRNMEMELMSAYVLHARALHQQNLSAKAYKTTLDSIATAGPEILGESLQATISGRAAEMQELIDGVAAQAQTLGQEAMQVGISIMSSADSESSAGQAAMNQLEIFSTLMEGLGGGIGGGGVTTEIIGDGDDTVDEPAE